MRAGGWRAVAAAEVVALAITLLLLGLHYARLFPNLGGQGDLWFGMDLPRVIGWIVEPGAFGRWHLHPLLLPPAKLYGFVLSGPGLMPPRHLLPAFALPLVAATTLCVVWAAHLVARACDADRASPLTCAMLLAIGPLAVAGPVPESHALGGAVLLLQATLLLAWLDAPPDGQPRGRLAIGVIGSGAVATGITVSCALPALIVATPLLWSMRHRRTAPIAAAVIPGVAAAGLVGGLLTTEGGYGELFAVERIFIHRPTLHTAALSLGGLVVRQFGMPQPILHTWSDPFVDREVASIDAGPVSVVQIMAMLAWGAAIAGALRNRPWRGRYGALAAVCLAALAAQLAFHSVYGSRETFMLSSYSWPYVVLPGAVAATVSARRRQWGVVALAGVAVMLSVAQTTRSILALNELVGRVGIEAGSDATSSGSASIGAGTIAVGPGHGTARPVPGAGAAVPTAYPQGWIAD